MVVRGFFYIYRKDTVASEYIIGVDESGTGAWAGPFTLCAIALPRDARIPGVTDSKALSDRGRRNLLFEISVHSIFGAVDFGTVADVARLGLKETWRRCVVDVVAAVVDEIGAQDIVIDGLGETWPKLARAARGGRIKFEKKADIKYPAVSAASIVAKTARNDEMLRLHSQYPEYEWNRNYGYGVPRHIEVIGVRGASAHHRAIKPLQHVPRRNP